MNGLNGLSSSISSTHTIDLRESQSLEHSEVQNIQGGSGHIESGKGALEGRQISVGDGTQSAEGRGIGDKIKNGFLRLGQGLLAIVTLPLTITAGLTLGVAALGKVIGEKISGMGAEERYAKREEKAEQRFVLKNQAMLNELTTPRGPTLTSEASVMDRLEKHAESQGKSMDRAELTKLVAAGENIAKALKESPTGGSPLKLGEHNVESNTYTARALSWYMMAVAAKQDDVRDLSGGDSKVTSDMTTFGSFVMKDPGNKIFNFLNAAPTAGTRMSTHFEERLGHSNEHLALGFIPTFGKSEQRGIEDYQSKMPGKGGTMLFDKLKTGKDGQPELFVKFEAVGCPLFFSSENHHTIGDKFLRFFASLDRNIRHVHDFKNSQNQVGGNVQEISRQEHVKKGVLKEPVFDKVKELVQQAVDAGIMDKDAVSGIAKSMGKLGMPAALNMVEGIINMARKEENLILENNARQLQQNIQAVLSDLGSSSDHYGIERRGAEVHISLDPAYIQN